jgi:predicted metal-dependent hydrolase
VKNQSYDPRYLEGIRWFNERCFFEAHEAWEELWLDCEDADRRFHQGLIQVAVCLHHFCNGNTVGARKLYHSSRAYLEQYGRKYRGLDIEGLLVDLEKCCSEILQGRDYPQARIAPELTPTIRLTPAPG